MKKTLKLAFLFLSLNFCFGQNYTNQLQGCWVNYKTELKMDSLNIPNNIYLNFTFVNNKIYMNNDPTLVVSPILPVEFEIKKKLIKTSKVSEVGYIIEKINNDTLILSNSFENGAKRFYFINEKTLCNISKSEMETEEDVFVANHICTPKQKKSILQYIYPKLKGKINSNFRIEGVLSINNEEKKAQTSINNENIRNEKKLNKIISYLNETYSFWDLDNFQHYKKIEISFVIIAYNVEGFENLQINFL
jgi:hypothetical protein